MNLAKLFFVLPSHLIFGIIGILGIGFLIGFHELGHFLFAKLFHVRVPSFSIGFGPQIVSKKIGETTFSLSAIPLGGYVEISGLVETGQGEQKEAHDADETSFASKPFYQKLLILCGGILFNLMFAYFAFTLLFMTGAPKTELIIPLGIATYKPVANIIMKDSPAEKAGLKPGDEIVGFNDKRIDGDFKKLEKLVRAAPNQPVTLMIKRENVEQTVPITLGSLKITVDGKEKEVGYVGYLPEIASIPEFGFLGSIKQGFRTTNFFIVHTLMAFKNIFVKRDASQIGGPLMIIRETIKGAKKGFKVFLLFLAIISINLAVLNLFPLPILDGGQILFVTIEALFGRPLPLKIREYVHLASWLLILTLILYLTAKDVGLLKLFGMGK